jgi:hypothetical protein
MIPPDEFPVDQDAQRMARVSALFEMQRHQKRPSEGLEAVLQTETEVPCKLAPAVLRRHGKRLTE